MTSPPVQTLEPWLNTLIRGQAPALRGIADAIIRAEAGLSKAGRPRGVFLFLGPTGTGKTETSLNLARFLHGSADAVARFDMGEYGHEDSLKRLIGENKSDPGLLGEAIDARPEGGILLLDEIEKADPKISKVFLGATDAARVTSADGITRQLDRWYLIFTSNLGSASAARMTGVPHKMVERTVISAATRFFSPETMARFTNKIVFGTLSYETQRQVAADLAAREVLHFESVGREKGLHLRCSVTPAATAFLVRHGHTCEMGARPMRDAVERLMGGPFARWILDFISKDAIKIYLLEFDATEGAVELSLNVRTGEETEKENRGPEGEIPGLPPPRREIRPAAQHPDLPHCQR